MHWINVTEYAINLCMNNYRQVFKQVKLNNCTYLYPMPVIKNHKYLIQIDDQYVYFFMHAFEHAFVASPDEKLNWLVFSHVHTDGNTSIFTISFDQLVFRFFEVDNDQSIKLTQLLTQKIKAVLKQDILAVDKLKQIYLNQLKCSTCQSLGIAQPKLKQLIGFLTNEIF